MFLSENGLKDKTTQTLRGINSLILFLLLSIKAQLLIDLRWLLLTKKNKFYIYVFISGKKQIIFLLFIFNLIGNSLTLLVRHLQ